MMYRALVFGIAVLTVGGSVSAEALAVAGSTQGICTYLARDVAYGMRSADVLDLQKFIVSLKYPGSGTWMQTGYFGRATEQGVRNFQEESGLAVTGYVDALTRSAIMHRGCDMAWYRGFNIPSYPPVPTNLPYPYPHQVYLDSISPTSASAGASITLRGSGFDRTANTVRFGSTAAYGAGSYDGMTLTVIVPNLNPGTYPITVTNTYGVSASLPFTVTSSGYYGAPVISSIGGPTSLRVGDQGVWTLSLSTGYNQYVTTSVEWGDEYQGGYAARVSNYVQGVQTFTHTYMQRGTYTIRFTVRNSYGQQNQTTTTVYVY